MNWLHLSDLHTGMAAQDWLWPRFEKDLLEDLSRLHEKCGPWHFLLFTGDLVRTGTSEEFKQFDDVLGAIVDHLRSLGSHAGLITLPGNHDLMRPSNLDAKAVALDQYRNRPDLQEDFWANDKAGYRSFVNSLFQNYLEWRDRAIASGIHLSPDKDGFLTGDASYVISAAGTTAKCVTLNSTWLQIAEGNFEERLELNPLQLIAAIPDKPDVWLSDCDFSIVATHQPPDWLSPTSQDSWRSDVYTSDRFDLHAFGHMHTPDTKTFSRGGGKVRREFQAASLFGLERTAAGLERIQGYSANRFDAASGPGQLTIWPRRLVPVADGERKLKPDAAQDLSEDNCFVLALGRDRAASTGPKSDATPVDSFQPNLDDDPKFKIENIEVILPVDPGHAAVRLAEQQAAQDAWAHKSRGFWLSSDWGFGEDSFIGSIKALIGTPKTRCYKLSLEDFRTKRDFLESVRVAHGVTFEEICDRIDSEDGLILILSDAPLRSPPSPACHALAAEIESLVYTTRDYLENGRFVITSRTAPASPSLPVISLKALDEPDIRAYVTAQRSSDPSLTSAATISRLFQVTDGHPGRLDAALKQLEVVSLSELVMTNSDLEPTQPGMDVPAALPTMIAQLKNEGVVGQRSHELLQSLSLFPSGEQLERIRRFEHTKPYFPPHATMLLDRHLIEAVTYSQMGDSSNTNEARLLVVPRPVREFVRASFTAEESARLDRKAQELYFGDNWKEGLAKGTIAARIAKNPLASPHDLSNCDTIILRAIVRAKEVGNEVDIEAAIRVATAFVAQQVSGGHYRSALALCEDLIPLLRGDFEKDLTFIQIEQAKCLRMTGRVEDARDAYLNVDTTALSKSTRQEIFLGLAMSYYSSDKPDEAKRAAEEAIKLGASTLQALHARVVLAQLDAPGPARDTKLDGLLQKAKTRKSHILENNIKIFKAESADQAERKTILRNVIDSSRTTGDFYNKFRAILRLFEDREVGAPVSHGDKMTLIVAYHFFHNERMNSNFNRVHEILWRIFEEEGDIWNLLSLFRHSSFIWRLAGRAASEKEYIDVLRLKHDRIVRSNIVNLNRERKYFLTRLQAVAEE